MQKLLIVDDEQPARERLRQLVSDIDGWEVVGEATNGRDCLVQASHLEPEIVLLDIRMNDIDGIEAARHLAELDRPPAVIFTTAFGEHALEAFETHAVDYLLKPIRRHRLQEALTNASRLTRAQLWALQSNADTQQERRHICARVRDGLKLIPIEDVIYFQADQKYVTVRHVGGEVLIEESLKSLEEEFENRLTRVHRNALVANAYIEGLEKTVEGHFCIRMRDCEERLNISRRHSAAVRRKLVGQVAA